MNTIGCIARQFEFDVQAGMVGVTVPIPVPVSYHLLRRVEGVAVRRHTCLRTPGRALLHRTKVVTSRWPDPANSSVDLGFPQNR